MMSSRTACVIRLPGAPLPSGKFFGEVPWHSLGHRRPGCSALITRREQQKADHRDDQDHQKQEVNSEPFLLAIVIPAVRAIGQPLVRPAPVSLLAAGAGKD